MKKILLLSVLFLTGCGTLTFPPLIPQDPIKKDFTKTIEKGCKPIYEKKDNIETYLGQACKEKYVLSKNWGGEKTSFLNKLLGALGNFTIWTIIAFVIFFIISPAAAINWIRSRQYKKALTQTVSALKEADVINDTKIVSALSDKQDNETKDLIDLIRNKL
jgi:hypothetical protein